VTELAFEIMSDSVSIIGLGKLGACMMVSFASKGFKVFGVEIDKERAELLKQGKTFHYEPNLNEYLNEYKSNISITDNYEEAIHNTDTTFVVVNTPSDSTGAFSVEYLVPACKQIGAALKTKDSYHLVSVTSTIMPGATRNQVLTALESKSEKRVGKQFGLCYNPEFIALGSVIRDFLKPDFILIGESDEKAGDILSSIYIKLIKDPKIRRMSYENAEITKIALNSYITMKISFANQLAEMCNRIPGADVDTITESLGMDSRIGKKYLRGAMSFGGPCFPRDNKAFFLAAKITGCELDLPATTDNVNRKHIEFIANMAISHCKDSGRVAILGGSYKPNTDVIEASPSIEIAKHIVASGIKVSIHDPVATKNIQKQYNNVFHCTENISECIDGSDVCIITTPWEQYKALSENDFKGMKGSVVIDCWRILKPFSGSSNAKLVQIGVGI
jgi:UDPglucose 6-dehydrogenase